MEVRWGKNYNKIYRNLGDMNQIRWRNYKIYNKVWIWRESLLIDNILYDTQ
jgi:hypothetical protein